MVKYPTIYDMIISEEARYSLPVTLQDGWDWSMKDHLKTSFFYKFGRLLTGNTDDKPVKNITRPILNLAYRAEDIDVKDIHFYVNDYEKFHLSFLIKKYHDEVFLKENDLDTFFDEVKEEKIDYGGSLITKVKGARPERVPLQSIAFCDQNDILSAPLGIKYTYSPSELKKKELVGWGDVANGASGTVDDVITLSTTFKTVDKESNQKNQSTGNAIEVYVVRGDLPAEWLDDNEDTPEENKYITQLHVVTFYKAEDGKRRGITLFKGKDDLNNLKFINRDAVFNRALGFGGAEELFEPQVWTNYSVQRKKDMLDSASKTIMLSTDSAFAQRNKIKNMENLEIAVVAEGKEVRQMDTTPKNIVLFDTWINEWEQSAKQTGSATGALLGEANTGQRQSYNAIALITSQGQAIHTYRKGKYAKFIEEIYTDWIIPYIGSEIAKGATFLATFSSDEIEYLSDCLVRSEVSKKQVELVLNGQNIMSDEEEQAFSDSVRQEFAKGGNKRFIEILKGEMKDIEIKVKVNVAGKEKDLAGTVDKLKEVFKDIIASTNPQTGQTALDNPKLNKIFQKIIEYSDLDPIDFASPYEKAKPQQMIQGQAQQPQPSPFQPQQLPINNQTK